MTFLALPYKEGHSGLMPPRVCGPSGGGSEFYSVQGAGCGQLVDNSRISCLQAEVSCIINLLVPTSLGSMFLWSAVFIQRSASCENNLGMCVCLYLYCSGN